MQVIGIEGIQYEMCFITDKESDCEELHIDEYENLSDLNELAERIESVDEDLQALL